MVDGGQTREKSSLCEQMREILSPWQTREIFRPCAHILPTHGRAALARAASVISRRPSCVCATCRQVDLVVSGGR